MIIELQHRRQCFMFHPSMFFAYLETYQLTTYLLSPNGQHLSWPKSGLVEGLGLSPNKQEEHQLIAK